MHSVIHGKFSIIRGGLFYRLQERLNLVNKNDSPVVVRAFIFALVSWLPLFLLSASQGLAINDDPHRSLLLDFSAYGQFLLAIPLLIIAENIIDDRYVTITSYFLNSGVVPDNERSGYIDILRGSQRLIVSGAVEIVLLVLAYLGSTLSIFLDFSNNSASWKEIGRNELSIAGWWCLLISLPLFQFLLLRWIWRLIVWCIFLWRLSRLDLRLVSTHPDFVGGLGILGESIYAFTPIMFALSILLASNWSTRVIYEGAAVTDFQRPFIAFLLLMTLIAAAPLMIFTGRLIQLKLRGLHDYGVLANHHSLLFEEKWIRDGEKNIGSVLGTPDISSLCDLTTDYQTVRNMKFFPLGLQNVLVLIVALCIPMIPLVLIEIPFKDLVLKLAGVVF